jgi:hypothetical protein
MRCGANYSPKRKPAPHSCFAASDRYLIRMSEHMLDETLREAHRVNLHVVREPSSQTQGPSE